MIFYVWRDGYRVPMKRRERRLRARVAYMLWTMADELPDTT